MGISILYIEKTEDDEINSIQPRIYEQKGKY
jgi:hypothetical protein